MRGCFVCRSNRAALITADTSEGAGGGVEGGVDGGVDGGAEDSVGGAAAAG